MSDSKRRGSVHHIIARSVGGPDTPDNKYRWRNKKKHQGFHHLFYNFLPSVVIEIIKLWSDGDDHLVPVMIGPGNVRVWNKTFPGASPSQVIKFISRKFLPIERKYLRGELGGNHEKKQDVLGAREYGEAERQQQSDS